MNLPTVRSALRSLTPVPMIVLVLVLFCLAGAVSGETITISTSGPQGKSLGFGDEDIVIYDTSNGAWTLLFDGSDVGLVGANVNGFARLSDGSILIAVSSPVSLPGAGSITESDLVQFLPVELGGNTSGTWQLYFDGSDVGLQEGIDAVAQLPNGHLILSTTRSVELFGAVGADASDLLRFVPGTLGSTTSGSWELYFDGSDVGLGPGAPESVNGVAIDPLGDLYVTTKGRAVLPGLRAFGRDVLRCAPFSLGADTSCTLAPFWTLPGAGVNAVVIDGLSR